MRTNLKEVLRAAQAGSCAVPAFDCMEHMMVRTILETCESLRTSPTPRWRSALVAACSQGEWSRS